MLSLGQTKNPFFIFDPPFPPLFLPSSSPLPPLFLFLFPHPPPPLLLLFSSSYFPTPSSPLPPPPAACYDATNHCVWTASDDWIDVWTCASCVRPAAHLLAVRMNHPSLSSLIPPSPTADAPGTILLRDAIDLLLRHSGIESCRLVPSRDFSDPITHSLSLKFLRHCCIILEYSVEEKSWNNALASIITLQVCGSVCLSVCFSVCLN